MWLNVPEYKELLPSKAKFLAEEKLQIHARQWARTYRAVAVALPLLPDLNGHQSECTPMPGRVPVKQG